MTQFDRNRRFDHKVAIQPTAANVRSANIWLEENNLKWCVDFLNRESQVKIGSALGSSYLKNVFEFSDPAVAMMFKLRFG